MFKYTAFLIFFLIFCTTLHSQDNVAVMDFAAKGVSVSEASMVADFFRSDLVGTKAFTVLDRANMEKILGEQSFQQSGCSDSECAVQVGKLLNMQYMFIGSLAKFGDNYVLSVDMINVETGAITDSAKDYSPDINKMLEVTGKLASRFSGSAGGSSKPSKVKTIKPKNVKTEKVKTEKVKKKKSRSGSPAGPILMITGGTLMAGSGVFFGLAESQYKDYQALTDPEDITAAKNKTIGMDRIKWIVGSTGAGLLVTGLILKLAGGKSSTKAGHAVPQVAFNIADEGMMVQLSRSF